MRFSLVSLFVLVAISGTALAAGYDRGPAVQNPMPDYENYCTDPAVTAEMNFGRICDEMRGVVRIDLFNDDQSAIQVKNHETDWPAFARGPMTKPYIPFMVDTGQGQQTLDFGDVRWYLYGLDMEVTRMAIRVNGVDNIEVCFRGREGCPTGYQLTDEKGFSVFKPDITNLAVTSLSGEPVTVEVAIFTVERIEDTDTHDVSHHLNTCQGELSTDIESTRCGGWAVTLLEYRTYSIGEWETQASSFTLK